MMQISITNRNIHKSKQISSTSIYQSKHTSKSSSSPQTQTYSINKSENTITYSLLAPTKPKRLLVSWTATSSGETYEVKWKWVKMIGYKDISYRKTSYKLTSTPDLGVTKFGDGVWAVDPCDCQGDHYGWFGGGWYVGVTILCPCCCVNAYNYKVLVHMSLK
jgi:hypothetical protein